MIQEQRLTLPIPKVAYQIAQSFSDQQPTPTKARQVRSNTLAVQVVHHYLQLMGIDTDLDSSDSWNPVVQLCADVADLTLPGLGQLECRPIAPQALTCDVPPESWDERIAYVVVQLNEAQHEAHILGFVPNLEASGQITLADLDSPETLLTYLHQLQSDPQPTNWVRLRDWLTGTLTAGWQTLESLLSEPELTWSFRATSSTEVSNLNQESVQRAQLLAGDPTLLLTVSLAAEFDEQWMIRIQVRSLRETLPLDLVLQVLDATHQVFLTAQARAGDDYMQLQLKGYSGERFRLQLTSQRHQFSEGFVI